MQMKEWKFRLLVNGGYCEGVITVKAETEEEAYTAAEDSFVYRWIEAFPELDVGYSVELVEEEN